MKYGEAVSCEVTSLSLYYSTFGVATDILFTCVAGE